MPSCRQRSKQSGNIHVGSNDSTKNVNNNNQTSFGDTLKLPVGFVLDSMITFDSARNVDIQIILPRDKGTTTFDKRVLMYMKQRLKNFRLYMDTLIQNDSSILQAAWGGFYVDPVSVYKDDKIVSYCFIISSDYPGAVHPFSEYYSFNYDLRRNKQLTFPDYFNIRSGQDSLTLISIINKAINQTNIAVEKLDNIDFNIEKDSIGFNFDDYEIAGYADGIIKTKLAKESLPLSRYIRNGILH